VPGGAYVINRQLPGHSGECEYQIKSAREPATLPDTSFIVLNGRQWVRCSADCATCFVGMQAEPYVFNAPEYVNVELF
jgi:hypothetical protein